MKLEMLPYKNVDLKTNKILEQLTLSSRALAELKGYSNTIPNMHILINAVIINNTTNTSIVTDPFSLFIYNPSSFLYIISFYLNKINDLL